MKLAVALLITAACGGSQPSAKATASNHEPATKSTTPASLPAEVQTLLDRWEQCWHFAGEEPYDAQRQKEIADEEAKYCPGNDEERARLRAKYRDRRDVQDALTKLDEMQ